MSSIIPPLLSNSPPPSPLPEEDEDDEFGDFTGANDLSYGCDNLSLPPSPDHSPKELSIPNGLDINSNADKNKLPQPDVGIGKDFQDRRKLSGSFGDWTSPVTVEEGCIEDIDKKESLFEHSIKNDFHIDIKTIEHKSEINNKALINDKVPFSEKGNEVEANVNNLETPNHKVTYVQEVLTRNFENEMSDFIVNSSDFPINSSKEIVFNGDSGLIRENSDLNMIKEDFSNCHNDLSSIKNLEDIKDNIPDDSLPPTLECCAISDDSNKIHVEIPNIDSTVIDDCDLQKDTSEVEMNDCESSQEDETVTKADAIEIIPDNRLQELFADESFGDFASVDKENCAVVNEFDEFAGIRDIVQDEENVKINDFGNFSSHPITTDNTPTQETDEFDDDFGDFASTTIPAEQPGWDNVQFSQRDDDDFGSFADFSEGAEEPVILTLNEKEAFEKAKIILKEIFPSSDDVKEDYHYVEVEKDDVVFNELKDVTETPALLYQWSKSNSQNVLLKALNIDARNILYGPSWNPSMPRFAANLGLMPLEPVRSEILTPTAPKSSPSISVQPANVEIPTAQFDWNGSGLVNPLDSVSKQYPESSPPSDIAQKQLELTVEPSLILQPKPASSQVPSKNDLELKPDDDFDDFASYQPTQTCQAPNWPSVPLRETYISNDNVTASGKKEIPLEIEGWLQPTIVTPELPRKDLSLEDELPDVQTPELCRKNVVMESLQDDFDDFQMVLPETKVGVTDNCENKLSKLGDTDIPYFDLCQGKTVQEEPNKRSLELDVEEEDEFTDFHSFAPVTPETLTPIQEPLKPVPVYAKVQFPTMSTSTLINWPDPGVTDEEIKKFEMVFSQPQKTKTEEPKIDDDEWSDFVSVKKPSPVHKFQSKEVERTSSPDLPLSVLNLGSVQPAKQPIPVITPHGLVQTKLSSHNSTNASPKAQSKHKSTYQTRTQPSIISNQFASQAYNFNGHAGAGKSQKSLDDDDWSDFVSSPLPASGANGCQQAAWATSPNVTMNPGCFVRGGGKRVPDFSAGSRKSTVPDLEFIAPKGRTSSSRRK